MEFEGIKFTSKSFQFEMNARQMLVIDEKPIFNSCLIKPRKKDEQNEFDEESNEKNGGDIKEPTLLSTTSVTTTVESLAAASQDDNGNSTDDKVVDDAVNTGEGMQNEMKQPEPKAEPEELFENKKNEECLGELKVVKAVKDLEIKISQTENKKVKQEENVEERDDELVEVNLELPQELELDSSFEKLKLQNASEVYYKMYKEAKEKAKSAKKIAVEAYLAAEEIKFTYNLVDNESDSDDSSNEGESESESENESDNHNGDNGK
jgi:hypothetical protein